MTEAAKIFELRETRTVQLLLQKYGNLDEKELLLIDRVLNFTRDRKAKKMTGRMELHADQNGVICACPVWLNDKV